MTILIELPGTLTNTSGLDRVLTTVDGFPDDGLASLFLFEDGSGTAPENSVAGADPGMIESVITSNNAYSWLTGGGGLHLEGGQILSMPPIDLRNPWTLVQAGKVTGSVGDTTSAKNYQLLSFRSTLSANFRGVMLYLTGGTNWNTSVTNNYAIRASNGSGGVASAVNLAPGNTTVAIGTGRVRILSYDGSSVITSSVYDKDGTRLQTNTTTTTDTNLVTGASAVVQNTVQPILGPNATGLTYAGGKQDVEAAAVYSRVLSVEDIATICIAAAALADARGRTW